MEFTAEQAKQICKEHGIKWDDNATEATLNGKPIHVEDSMKMFPRDVPENEFKEFIKQHAGEIKENSPANPTVEEYDKM